MFGTFTYGDTPKPVFTQVTAGGVNVTDVVQIDSKAHYQGFGIDRTAMRPERTALTPARTAIRSMFDEVHGSAEWVATYDDLFDKRQLVAQGINVIRYKRQRTHGRNMIVSSTSELRLLHVLVKRRLNELGLGLVEEQLSALAQRMISDASSISGDIVLRAAQSRSLRRRADRSRPEPRSGGGRVRAAGLGRVVSLDDYAEWLGQTRAGHRRPAGPERGGRPGVTSTEASGRS